MKDYSELIKLKSGWTQNQFWYQQIPRFAEEHEGAQGGEVDLGVTPQRLRLRRIRALRDGSESGASQQAQDPEHS